jgi:hypothetical protein
MTSTVDLRVVVRGRGLSRKVRVCMPSGRILGEYPVGHNESDEDAHKRVLAAMMACAEFRGVVATTVPFDDTMAALLLDEEA